MHLVVLPIVPGYRFAHPRANSCDRSAVGVHVWRRLAAATDVIDNLLS